MLRTIRLYGTLKKRFGEEYRLEAATPAECIRALCIQVPGFQQALAKGQYRFIRGKKDAGIALQLPLLSFGLGKEDELHLIPAGGVAGKGGVGKVLLGAVMIGAAFIPGAQAFVALNVMSPLGIAGGVGAFAAAGTAIGIATKIGLALVLGGISTMLTPKTKGASEADKKESFIFGGAQNTAAQGVAKPLVYGLVMAGSVMVSSGISIEQLMSGGSASGSYGSYTGTGTPGIGDKYGMELEAQFAKGGKGSGSSSSGQEDPNTLQSSATARVIDLISEGPIGGLATAYETGNVADQLKDVYFDDVPVQNADGTYNYKGMIVEQRVGNPSDDPMKGFSDTENEITVGAQVKAALPVTRSISDALTDSARLTITVPSLYQIDADKGTMKGTNLTLKIDVQPQGGTYQTVVNDTISGKTNSQYQRSYRFDLPGVGPWLMRLTRVTPDSTESKLSNDLTWSSYTEVVESKLIYPNSAMMGVTIDAQQFGSNVPNRAYRVYGRIIKVPTNFDPKTRVYATSGPGTTNGVWDGTFKDAWTDNPAWVLNDIITHPRYGLGNLVSQDALNKWALYEIARYCDGMVPDGTGGQEPRYTINTQITDRGEAWDLLMSMVSVFRGMLYWGAGAVEFAYDHDETPTKLVTKANVIDGRFSYSSDTLKGRHSSVIVSWNDPDQFYRTNYEVVEDSGLIAKYGPKPLETSAWGCTSRGQAHRVGRWILDTEKYGEIVTYQAGLDHADVRPGSVIEVNDPEYTATRMAGRALALGNASNGVQSISLDAPVVLDSGVSYQISLVMADGSVETKTVRSGAGTTSTLNVDAFSKSIVPGCMWSMKSSQVTPRLFRVTAVEESGPITYTITATWHDPNKFARVEQGLDLPPNEYSNIPTGALVAPEEVNLSEYLYSEGDSTTPGILVAWSAAKDPRVTYYQYQLRRPNTDAWEQVAMTSRLSDTIRDSVVGQWAVRVRSCDDLGHKSPWLTKEGVTISAGSDPIASVGEPGVVRNDYALNTVLRWDRVVDVRPVVYDIYFNEVNDFGTAKVVFTTDGTEYIVPQAGFYWVQPRFGDATAAPPTVVEVKPGDLPQDKSAHDQIKETQDRLQELVDSIGDGDFGDLQQYVDAAKAAQTAAETAKTESQAARDASSDFAAQAEAAQKAAEDAIADASQAVTDAQSARDAANAAAATAAQRASDANGYAQTSQGQATIATQKADAAGQYASNASASATTASTKAGEASTSASQAVTAKNDAAGSATSAATQAGIATTAKNDAQTAASASASSASAASSSATAADQRASAADTSRVAAETAKGAAEASSSSAASSASNAAGSANSASSSAIVSASAKNTAVSTAANLIPGFDGTYQFWSVANQNGRPEPGQWESNGAYGPQWSSGSGVTYIYAAPIGRIPKTVGRRYRALVRVVQWSGSGCRPRIYWSDSKTDGSNSRFRGWTWGSPVGSTSANFDPIAGNTWYIVGSEFECTADDQDLIWPTINVEDIGGGGIVIASWSFADVTSEVASKGYADASASSASSASASNTAAGQSATAASGSATSAATSAGQASTSAGQASTSASNAQGSANSAASSATVSASARDTSLSLVGNEYFDNGLETWIGHADWVVRNSYGRKNVAITPSGRQFNEVTGRSLSVTPGQRIKLRLGFRLAFGGPTTYYFGYFMYDAGGSQIYGSDGSGNYPLGAGFVVSDYEWKDRETIIGRGYTGPNYGGTVTIPDNCATIRPVMYINYTGVGDSITEVDYFAMIDATSEAASKSFADASSSSASSAAASNTAAGQSASAAEGSRQSAATAAGQANAARDTAVTAKNDAQGSANTAASQASLAASASSAAVQSVATSLPSGFDPGGTFWSVYFEGSPARSNDLASYNWVINNDGAFLRMGASGGQRDIAHRGAIPLLKNRRLRITAQWRTDSAPRAPITAVLYFIGLNGTWGSTLNPGSEISVSPGQTGWGGSDWKTDSFEYNTNDLIAGGAVAVRGLFRFSNTAPYEQNALRSLTITDVTSEYASQGYASAASNSASSASANAGAAGNSATAANQSRIDAQAANGSAQTAAGAAQSYAASADASRAQAQTSATIASSYSSTGVVAGDKFANWVDPGTYPAPWYNWSSEGNFRWNRLAGGAGSPYAIQTVTDYANANSGFMQIVKVWTGKWILEATVRCDGNTLVGAGLTVHGQFNVNFATEPDTQGIVDSGNHGFQTRTFSKVIDISQAFVDSVGGNANFHCMHGWTAFGAVDAKYMTWFMARLRPLDASGVQTLDNAARIETVNNTLANSIGAVANRTTTLEATSGSYGARISTVETVAADARGRTSAYWTVQAVAGGRAQLSVWADSNGGGGVDIVGDVRISGNALIDGTVTAGKMAVTSLSAISANIGSLVSYNGQGGRVERDGNGTRIYDNSGNLAVKWGF